MTMDAAIVMRYEQSISLSLKIMDSWSRAVEIPRLRQQIADESGTAEWREALGQAIAKFEAP